MIEWNEGLSLGVKNLDDDHKKLLNIINKLSMAIDDNSSNEVFEEIFADLEMYTVKHFKNEEEFIEKYDSIEYEKHKKQHEVFKEKIYDLKKKFFSQDSYLEAKNISIFLTDWLINHIINEDMKMINSFIKNGLIKQKKTEKSWFGKLVNKIIEKFSFTKRMLLSALIPLLGMLIFASIIVWDGYKQYKEVVDITRITHTIFDFNELTHSLQIERGLSSGYLSTKTDKFKKEIDERREIVDSIIEKLMIKLQDIHSEDITLILPHIKRLKNDIHLLKVFRKRINKKDISKENEMKFYTDMIHNILSIPSKIMLINTNEEISYDISILTSILYIKEIIGQERAFGTMLLEEKKFTQNTFNSFVRLLGAQHMLYRDFQQKATAEHQSSLAKVFKTNVAIKIAEYKEKIQRHEHLDLDSKEWFDIKTEHINNIKYFIDLNLERTHNLMKKNLDLVIKNLILWFIFIVMILIVTRIIIYIFSKSTKMQISQLAEGMEHLANAGRSLRLNSSNNEDEISHIYNAYEVTRQKLLEGDVFTQLYLSQEKTKYDNQKRMNIKLEELASIDSLTTLFNRRKFSELFKRELSRTISSGNSLSLLLLDIDFFKKINDTYGHATGDEVLKHFASVCKDAVRNEDVIARIGGEEFVIMLPDTSENGAMIFATRLCEKVFNSNFNFENKDISYSVSIGLTLFNKEEDKNLSDVLKKADKALYLAKENGRNRVELYS